MSRGIPQYVGQFYRHKPIEIVLTEQDIKAGQKFCEKSHFTKLVPSDKFALMYVYRAVHITNDAINNMRTTTP